MIRKTEKGYQVFSEEGKALSADDLTEEQAKDRLAEVEAFKHTKSDSVRVTRTDITGRFDASKRTPQGGLKLPAYVTRLGLLSYRQPDGSVLRELRHPDEVFKSDSLATLAGAPVTVGHPGKVTPAVWKRDAVGHVGDTVEPKDKYVSATLRVQDAATVEGIEKGSLIELSCGYDCDSIPGAGEYEGERYDARQVNISYNHVALLPLNTGRAGNDVRLRFDGDIGDGHKLSTMDTDDEKLRQDAADQKARADRAEGERDAHKARADKLEADFPLAVERTVKLREDARVILGDVSLTGKSAREVYIEAITKTDAGFKADGRSDDYLEALFDASVKSTKAGSASVASVRKTAEDAVGAGERDPIEEARKRNEERSRNAWKK